MSGPLDPWNEAMPTLIDEVDEEDDVYEPEDYTGDYPLESEVECLI
jgi:hypothetical protein